MSERRSVVSARYRGVTGRGIHKRDPRPRTYPAFREMCMWQFIGLAALVLSIVAVALLKGCRNAIKDQQDRLDHLSQKINRIEKPPALPLDKAPRPGPQAAAEPSALEDLLKRRVTLAQTAAAPSKPSPQQAPQPPARADEEAPEMLLEPAAPDTVTLHPGKKLRAQEQPKPFLPSIDRERWAKLEEKLGKKWITWVGDGQATANTRKLHVGRTGHSHKRCPVRSPKTG